VSSDSERRISEDAFCSTVDAATGFEKIFKMLLHVPLLTQYLELPKGKSNFLRGLVTKTGNNFQMRSPIMKIFPIRASNDGSITSLKESKPWAFVAYF
jgi:hypothetical protein